MPHRHRSRLFRLGILATVALLLVLLPSAARAWWNDDWSYRKKITLDAGPKGAALDGDSGRMAVLIRLHDGNFKFEDAKDDGSDLRFVASDDKTPLKYHIEKFDSLLGVAFVWVDIPALKAGTTTDLWMYYGNSKAPPAVDSHGTYSGDQTLVYHFSEKSGPPVDQTAYKNDALTAGGATDASLIGGGLKLDGTSPVTLPDSASLAVADGAPLTWSVWIKPDADQATGVVFARHDGDRAFVIGLDQGVPYVSVTSGGTTVRSQPTDALAGGGWHHLAVTAADQITLYVDGQARGTVAAHLPALADKATLGGDPAGGGPAFVGEIDELELAKVARSPGFIAAAVASQGPNGKLVVYGEDEQTAGWSGGYFGVILKSVTLDGWVVIGILMVMALISWMVMVNKAIVVGRVARGNGVFLRAFHSIGRDLTALDGEIDSHSPLLAGLDARARRSIPDSSLYRIYRLGAEELRLRFGVDAPDAGYARILSAQSIAAIRAALDTGVVRETQRLNRLMVLLTIAISGGPFLGLLGTVVGVMITFAAIAAAGDVNVNAIAPGIAAALVATVAGLGVAIPALFGYNYLLTRIKDATADMHVFVDEFVTRLAEFYCTQPISRELAAE